jgi:hypothetical protein
MLASAGMTMLFQDVLAKSDTVHFAHIVNHLSSGQYLFTTVARQYSDCIALPFLVRAG